MYLYGCGNGSVYINPKLKGEKRNMEFKDLNLAEMDKNLTEPEKAEWQAIYASYRSGSVIAGGVAGVDF